MAHYEYKVVPAPTKGQKVKGARSTAERFANALETTMNALGAEGWNYVRADTLPCQEREGLLSKTTVYQNMLVFRRMVPAPVVTPAAETAEQHVAEALDSAPEPALIEDKRAPEATDDTAPPAGPPVSAATPPAAIQPAAAEPAKAPELRAPPRPLPRPPV